MKCIKCGTDNNLKDRTANQGRCQNCQHPFVFEPTSMGNIKITDPMFAKVISDLSVNNTLYFTPKQFLYFINRKLRPKTPGILLIFVIIINIAIVYCFGNIISTIKDGATLLFLILGAINFILIYRLFDTSKSNKIAYQQLKNNTSTLSTLGFLILFLGIISSLALHTFIGFIISVVLGMLCLYLGSVLKNSPSETVESFVMPNNQLQGCLDRWQEINGSIIKLLLVPREESTPTTVNPDVTAYSFDRLVVCDSAEIAQFLIANNFHFENNCAILSITGYPQSIFDTTMQMLRRNPDLKVYALHDCSPKGVGLISHLRNSPDWFRDSNITIIDVGISPRQLLNNRSTLIQISKESAQQCTELSPEVRQGLSGNELIWLMAGKYVELESFTPQKLIQVLHQGIAGSLNLDRDDSNIILIGDSSSYMYTTQSFG